MKTKSKQKTLPALQRPPKPPAAPQRAPVPAPVAQASCLRTRALPPELPRGPLPEPAMLRVHQVARRLGVTSQHVRDFIDEGALDAINIGKAGRRFWRVPVDAYQAFLKERSTLDKVRP
ncbi:MAG: hypothetical protein ACLQVX_17960 [Limisphaerales bacterium]